MRSGDAVAMQAGRDDVAAERRTTADVPTPEQEFTTGDRVRMNELGRSRHPRYGERQAVVVRKAAASGWRVQFDDRNSLQTIHRDYLEKVETAAGS